MFLIMIFVMIMVAGSPVSVNAASLQGLSACHGPIDTLKTYPQGIILFETSAWFPDQDAFNLVFSPDGNTLWFSRANPGYTQSDIFFSRRLEKGWGEAQKAAFSSDWVDFDPFVSSDRQYLLFVSNRAVQRQDCGFDIWMVEFGDEGWREPVNLGAEIYSGYHDSFMSVALNGNLYFCSDRPGGMGSYDIYRRHWVAGRRTAPENLGQAINSHAMETDPLIAPDERFIIFSRGNLYISFQVDGQ